MERSAVYLFSAACASIGVLFGVYVSNWLIGTDDPEYFFAFSGLLAMPFAAGAYVLASRRFWRVGAQQKMFFTMLGLVLFLVSVAVMLVGIYAIFPKAVSA